MKAVTTNIGGNNHLLALTAEAMFEIEEKHGSVSNLFEKLEVEGKESFLIISETVELLAEHAELARRHLGHSPKDTIKAETVRALTQPKDTPNLVDAIARAITRGFGKDIERDEADVDIVLSELEEKKTQ